ncbi:lysylphosphatidylglycerol synthase domain-containing protein [Micromonospora chersina]|uniref:lysylphosphatidylglycerol synthase domain-containing protein n=1 Tax=Micromonospora chersina TaxID=47854 RepID=UPI003716198D
MFGVEPFLRGLRLFDAPALAAAFALGVVTTVCCAGRWVLIARALGVGVPLLGAIADCYRAVFLNATLSGVILGDLHGAIGHGRHTGDVARGIRIVVWERAAGQVVLVAVAGVAVVAMPSPVRPYLPTAAAIGAGGLTTFLLLRWRLPRLLPARWRAATRAAAAEARAMATSGATAVGVLLTSAVAMAGYLATLLLAARTAGVTAPLGVLIPLALLALVAMAAPANVAGFGPREGVAAWAFGAAGLTAAEGIAATTVYGALVLAASLPGLVVLLLGRTPGSPPRVAAAPAPRPPLRNRQGEA